MRAWQIAALPAALAAVITAGCGKQQMRSSVDSTLITQEEIAQTGLGTAHEVIQRLRPQWLRIYGQRSITGGGAGPSGPGATSVVVYIDGVRAGDLTALDAIPAASVESLRYLDASQAVAEHGTGHLYGSIEVRTRHGGGK